MNMSNRTITIILTIVLLAAGASAFFMPSANTEAEKSTASASTTKATAATESTDKDQQYLTDFKQGYAEGFNEGVAGIDAASQTSLADSTVGYFDGFRQGFVAGQEQQAILRNQLCGESQEVGLVPGSRTHHFSSVTPTGRAASPTVLGDRYINERRESNGIGSAARKGLLIAGGAAAGAGLGGAFGGRKGALIGAAIGGGTGTALALTKKPNRAFNRRVTKKSALTKSLIGVGAGAAIGGLAGGKRGALSGAALGGGAGLLWSLLGK